MIRDKMHPQLKKSQPSVFHHVFRALQSRNFRLFLSGQLISLIGNWMQQVAMSWLLYRLTHSAFLLGMLAFLGQGPGFFIAPFAGILADRFSKHKILLITQTLSMAQALALAYLSLTGQIQVWHLFYLSIFMGIVSGVDIPVRQSFVPDMLDKPEDLSNAISLNSSAFNGTRLVGPAIAGMAIAWVGEGWCFFLNAISYVAVLIALLSMRLKPRMISQHAGSYWASLKEGFEYAYRFTPMKTILLLVAMVSLVGFPYSVLMPVYAKDILHGNAQTLGYLMGAVGGGALTGALYLALRRNVSGLERLIPVAVCLFGFALISFSVCRTLWLALPLMYLLGLGMMLHLASSQILLQTLAEDSKRGRVMSFYTMSCLGVIPFGSLMIGSLATHIGVAPTLAIGGTLCVAGATVFAFRLAVFQDLMGSVPATDVVVQEQQRIPVIR